MSTQPLPGSSLDPSHPLWPDVAPCDDNRNDSANAVRLLAYFGHELVIVLPDEADPDSEPEIYGVTSTGMLSRSRARTLVNRSGKRYHSDCKRLMGEHHPEYRRCADYANQMRGKFAFSAIRNMMAGVVDDLRERDLLPPCVVVTTSDRIDADLTCIGTPGGVLDLRTGEILPYGEARKRLVLSSTGLDYDPDARHPKVDEILPPIGPEMAGDLMQWYRTAALGYGMVHEPSREFIWEICAAGSGKSTFANAVQRALGRNYVRTFRREALRPDRFASATSYNSDLRHLTKPVRFAFVREIQGKLESEIAKMVSGGDDLSMRPIRAEDREIEITAHLWLMGNPRLRGGPQLDIADDDENTRAMMDRAKVLYRDPVPNPDGDVVRLKDPGFRRAALARLVEYTMACSVFQGFPPDPPWNREMLEEQRQSEMEDWQREWLPGVIRKWNAADGATPPACPIEIRRNFDLWWGQHGVGTSPSKRTVTSAVKAYHRAATNHQHCPLPKHGSEKCFVGYVMVPQPVSVAA